MMPNLGGRPLKFKTVEELQTKIDAYFDSCDSKWVEETYWDYPRENGKKNHEMPMVEFTRMVKIPSKPYGMAGLAYAVGLSRQGLIEYKAKEMFSDAIKDARHKVEADIEARMSNKETFTPGHIFNLKNNFDWKDQSQVDSNVNLGVDVSAEQAEQLIRARAKRSNS